MKNLLAALTVLFLSQLAWGGNSCISNATGFDSCKAAREFADDMATSLPMKMNKNMTIEKVFAIQNMVSLTVVLNYTEEYLKSVLVQNGTTSQELKAQMLKAVTTNSCQAGSHTALFIRSGVRLQYVYFFSDGVKYTTLNIDKCE